jgi:predicted deacylase
MSYNQYFNDSYGASRQEFQGLLGMIQQRWPEVELQTVSNCPDKECTTDIIIARPKEKQHLLMITTGQHGIEGYAGGAFLQLLAREYLDKLDPEQTGLVLVHAINPWGMANYRRVDQDNIDLNRNFITDWSQLKDSNKDYPRLRFFIEPGKLGKKKGRAAYYFRFIRALALAGSGGIKRALTLGQYGYDKGLYYGGTQHQPISRWLIDLYNEVLREYKHVLHVDIHTGYGPAKRMTIVNSALDPRDTTELKEKLAYDLVVKADPQEFYAIQGDMVDYMCWLGRQYPETQLYSTCMEFGTLGDSLGALVKSMEALIDENRLWHYGGGDPLRVEAIKKHFLEAFYPSCPIWRQRVVEDARRALNGILSYEGLV